jgi:ABC-type lipoprotein export system ATPase subunit
LVISGCGILVMESHSESPTFPREKAVILVMGASGSGKSTFIKNVTGRENIWIGNGLNSRQ